MLEMQGNSGDKGRVGEEVGVITGMGWRGMRKRLVAAGLTLRGQRRSNPRRFPIAIDHRGKSND
jgi:hypothetical protein